MLHEKVQTISVPSEWRPLSFANQSGTPVIWFEAEPTSPMKERLVFLMFTGDPAPDLGRYLGTATFGQNGFIVIHCYIS